MIPFVASIVVRVTIITVVALAATRLTRNGRASVRHVLLAAAFSALLIVPLLSFAPPARIAVPIMVPAEVASIPVEPIAESVSVADARAEEPGVRTAAATVWPSWSLLTAALWALGTALFMAPIAGGLWEIRTLRRGARPWRAGQSIVDALTREAAMSRRVETLLHERVPGPMTCGVVRPAIVLPPDAQHWDAQDLRRALVHELEHVRRGDWATHCAARLACAIYWFHPLVWIAWRALSLEAERACDDAVLRRPSTRLGAGAEPTVYADQLVHLAERLSTAARTPALAMANRADLAARVTAVLDSRRPRGRAGTRWVALACSVSVLLVMALSSLRIVSASAEATADKPAAAAPQEPADGPKFDIVSVRPCENEPPTPPGQRSSQGGFPNTSPGVFTIECGTVERLIGTAYVRYGEELTNQAARIGDVEWLKNVPGWLRSDKFTIEAKTAASTDVKIMLGPMLRALLEDRFKLKIHRATDEVPMYEMTLAKGGLKIKPDTCDDSDMPEGRPTAESIAALRAGGKPRCGVMTMLGNEGRKLWIIGGETMAHFAGTLSTFMDHHVIDKTGVTDKFNVRLEFAADETVPGPDKRFGPPASFPEVDGPNIFKALEQQVGVTLTTTKGPHGFLVIDHVEKPSPNRGPGLLTLTAR
jgi:uncharacterized protein (TIGR03435 family)